MKQKAGSKSTVRAIVGDVFPERGRRYAIAFPRENSGDLTTETSITFSLGLWPQKGHLPMKGQCVELSEIEMFAKGWRAQRVAPIKAQTTQATSSMEQR